MSVSIALEMHAVKINMYSRSGGFAVWRWMEMPWDQAEADLVCVECWVYGVG